MPTRVHVFHTADDDTGIGRITHDLELDLLPSQHALFNEDLVDAGTRESEFDDPVEFLAGAGNSSAGTSQRVGRPDHRGKPDGCDCLLYLAEACQDDAFRYRFTNLDHEISEFLPVLPIIDRFKRGAKNLNIRKSSLFREFCGHVEAGLAAHAGEDAVRLLPLDDLGDDVCPQRLDIDSIRHLRVGLDGCRI